MPLRCLPLFRKAASKEVREDSDRFDETIQPSKGTLSFMGIILRKDSSVTLGSSSLSTSSTRVSVSFNPKVEELYFDKSEAPSHIRTLTPSTSRKGPTRSESREMLIFSAPAGSPRVIRMGSPVVSSRRIERRHLITENVSN